MWQARESLRRLGTDYIDLYQLHWPDPETPKLETLRALQDLVRMGLVHYTDVSNHPDHDVVEFLELADRIGADRFVSIQEKYNVLEREIEADGRLDVARRYGLAILVYSPLAQGVLTGKYYDFKEGRWVVPELSRASQVDEAVEAVSVSLKDDDMKAIEEALAGSKKSCVESDITTKAGPRTETLALEKDKGDHPRTCRPGTQVSSRGFVPANIITACRGLLAFSGKGWIMLNSNQLEGVKASGHQHKDRKERQKVKS
nr:aldo/keto reductase [Acidilobus sp. 7A]